MKALAFNEFGGPDRLRLQEVPEPRLGPSDVLVSVRACALNHLDLFVREGIPALKTPLPFWSGCDIAGDVAAVGAAVEDVKVGARVALNPNLTCGRCEFCRQGEDSLCVRYGILGEHEPGGFAELVKVRGTNVLPLPDHVSYEEAAAFILVTLTAWRMLVTQAAVRLSVGNQPSVVGSRMGRRKELDAVMAQRFRGRLKAIIDDVMPFKDGAAAQRRLAEGKQFGKLVLKP